MSNGEEALNSRHACAACKHQRRKCENDCVFASHFPATRANYFREVHKIFGVKNVTCILEHLNSDERKRAVESLEWEAFAWKEDPVEGPLGLFRKLEKELELLKNPQQDTIVPHNPYQNKSGLIGFSHNSASEIVANSNIDATNFGYCNNPNLGLDVPMNNYSGLLQRADNIENQVVNNYIPVGSYYPIPQEQERSLILQERGLDVVAPSTTLLPKQEMQRNLFMGSTSNMRPATNYSFSQGNHQRGSQRRVHGHLDGPGSQGRGLH